MSPSCRRPTARLAAAVITLAAALLCLHVPRATAASGCALTSMSVASQGACWEPFTSSSPFNTKLSSSPELASDNGAVQQHMAAYGWSLGGSNSSFNLSLDGTRPVYFASASDPTMTIACTSSEGAGTCQGANGVDVNGMQVNVPAGAEPDGNWDGHMTVIETATGEEFDFWHTSIAGSTITAGTGAETNVNTGLGLGGGGDAAGFALTAGLLRPSELLSGQIDHALVIEVPCTNATGAKVGYTYPAAGGWGEFCGEYWSEQASTAPELGQRFVLDMTDAQIVASGAPTWEQTIMTALAHYGAYIEDTNGSWHNEGMYINTEDPTSWTSLGQQNPWTAVAAVFGKSGSSTLTSSVPIPVSRLDLVNTCVTQQTCPSSTSPVTTTPVTTTPVTSPVTTNPVTNPVTNPTTKSPVTTTGLASTSTAVSAPSSTTSTTATSSGTSPRQSGSPGRNRRTARRREGARRARVARRRLARIRRTKRAARVRAQRRSSRSARR